MRTFDRLAQAAEQLVRDEAVGACSLQNLVTPLGKPRPVWLMMPAAAVDPTMAELLPAPESGDTLIDRGNSYYIDAIRSVKALASHATHYVDVATSGGVWGPDRGFCAMIGGPGEAFARFAPAQAPRRPAAAGTRRLHPGQSVLP